MEHVAFLCFPKFTFCHQRLKILDMKVSLAVSCWILHVQDRFLKIRKSKELIHNSCNNFLRKVGSIHLSTRNHGQSILCVTGQVSACFTFITIPDCTCVFRYQMDELQHVMFHAIFVYMYNFNTSNQSHSASKFMLLLNLAFWLEAIIELVNFAIHMLSSNCQNYTRYHVTVDVCLAITYSLRLNILCCCQGYILNIKWCQMKCLCYRQTVKPLVIWCKKDSVTPQELSDTAVRF